MRIILVGRKRCHTHYSIKNNILYIGDFNLDEFSVSEYNLFKCSLYTVFVNIVIL